MKRDPDLIRNIALAAEALKHGETLNRLPDVSPHDFAAHVQLMVEAGLIVAPMRWAAPPQVPSAIVQRLTWEGHEFVDATRSDTLWQMAKDLVIKPTASWTIGTVTEWLRVKLTEQLSQLAP